MKKKLILVLSFIFHLLMTKKSRTIPIFGIGRGGTSLISGMLHFGGIHMGDTFKEAHPGSYECAEYWHILMNQRLNNTQAFFDYVNKNNQKHNIWGFKHPASIFYHKKVLESIPNPYPIVILRNINTCIESAMKYKDPPDETTNFKVSEYSALYNTILYIRKKRYPLLMLFTEEIQQDPVMAIARIEKHFSIELKNREKIEEFVNPKGGYKEIK